MNKLQLFIQSRGSIAYLVLLQAGLWIIAFFLSFAEVSLALPTHISLILTHPWSIITFSLLSYNRILFVIFDLMWLYGIGFLLRDYRNDKFILSLYFIAVYVSALIMIILSYVLNFPPVLIYGAPIGNIAILVATARLLPNLKIPLFLFGNIPLKWIVTAYVVLQVIFIGKYNLILIIISALIGFFGVNLPYMNLSLNFNIGSSKTLLYTEEDIDKILEKISKYGYDKLSRKEKKILEDYSRKHK